MLMICTYCTGGSTVPGACVGGPGQDVSIIDELRGKMTLAGTCVFAEFEHAILRQRVIAGMAEARKQGKAFGRPAHSSGEIR
jgi:hypothetical protein